MSSRSYDKIKRKLSKLVSDGEPSSLKSTVVTKETNQPIGPFSHAFFLSPQTEPAPQEASIEPIPSNPPQPKPAQVSIVETFRISEKFSPSIRDPINFFDLVLSRWINAYWKKDISIDTFVLEDVLARSLPSYARLMLALLSDHSITSRFSTTGACCIELLFDINQKRLFITLKNTSQVFTIDVYAYWPQQMSQIIRDAASVRDLIRRVPEEGHAYLPDELLRRNRLANEFNSTGIKYQKDFTF